MPCKGATVNKAFKHVLTVTSLHHKATNLYFLIDVIVFIPLNNILANTDRRWFMRRVTIYTSTLDCEPSANSKAYS